MPRPRHDHDDHPFDQGLKADLERFAPTTLNRRQILRWAMGAAAGAALLPVLGCGSSDDKSTPDPTPGTCTTIPEETAGPYPGDGSNGPNILTESGIVRSDIRSSIGSLSGTADGVPTTVTLTLVDTASSCAPLVGYAVYIWHCDQAGQYSLYTITDQNYLRGVQVSDDNGQVTFQTIFPACYSGRWPHIHFEVYPSLADAVSSGSKVATSQLAMLKTACDDVFATAGYEQSIVNLAQVSLASDMVFSDGATTQLPTTKGSAASGYTLELTVGIG